MSVCFTKVPSYFLESIIFGGRIVTNVHVRINNFHFLPSHFGNANLTRACKRSLALFIRCYENTEKVYVVILAARNRIIHALQSEFVNFVR